jgi:hypothetical protein
MVSGRLSVVSDDEVPGVAREVSRFSPRGPRRALERNATKKRGPQNEGITLWFAENKGDKKTTWLKITATPKCLTKISHLALRGLNVIEKKGG